MLKIDKVEIKWDLKTIDELQDYNKTPEAKAMLKAYGAKARNLIASRIPDNQTGRRYNKDRKINTLLKVSGIRTDSFSAHNEKFKSSSIVLSMPTHIKRYFYAAAGKRNMSSWYHQDKRWSNYGKLRSRRERHRNGENWIKYTYSSPTAKAFPFNDLYTSGFMDRFHNDWQNDFKEFLKKKLD